MIRKAKAAVLLGVFYALHVFFLALGACAAPLRDGATQVAVASKGIVDEGAELWSDYALRQVETCRAQNLPSPQAREKCLGPAAKTPEVELAFEAVHAAQLVLFVALTQDDDAAVVAALRDLAAKVQIVQQHLKAAGLLGGT